MTLADRSTKKLTSGRHDDKWPAWSADDSKIAFTSNRDGRWEIYTMTSCGHEIRRLTFGSEGRP